MTTFALMSLSCVVAIAASAAVADPVATFRSLCMSHLGDPAAINQAGQQAGFAMTALGTGSYMGMRDSTDESLQINAFTSHKFECAVTTSDVADPQALREQFFATLGISQRQGEARGAINGVTYTFKHDTNGGEAFVVFND